jgi:hypothetical protein
MGRIALQDLGYSERKLTYPNGLNLQEGTNLMNKGEVYTERTATLHEVETRMNKMTTRTAKVHDKGDKQTPGREPVRNRKFLMYLRLEPYEGKLSCTVLRRERAEQSALTQPTEEEREETPHSFLLTLLTFIRPRSKRRIAKSAGRCPVRF